MFELVSQPKGEQLKQQQHTQYPITALYGLGLYWTKSTITTTHHDGGQ